MTDCMACGTEMIHGGDHDVEEGDMDQDDENPHVVISNLTCPHCDSFMLFYHSRKGCGGEV